MSTCKYSTDTSGSKCVVYSNKCLVLKIFYGYRCHQKAIKYIDNIKIKGNKKGELNV